MDERTNTKTTIMNKEFIPYEQALALKELGFDEPCLSTYTWDGFKHDVLTCISENPVIIKERLNSNNDKYTYSAPLYQQAFRWFREKYQLHSTITSISQESWQWHITKPGELLGKLYDEDF